jgi:hypothetical protein
MLMSALRRFRVLFAAIAIIFSPGGVTPWLQLQHACGPESTMDMPGMEMPGMAQMAGHGHHDASGDPDQDGPGQHLQHCVCVGTCSASALVAPPVQQPIAVIPVEFRASGVAPVVTHPFAVPQHSHPFAQAPPLA